MTREQALAAVPADERLILRCALALHDTAWQIVLHVQPPSENIRPKETLDNFCTAGACTDVYALLLRRMGDLLRERHNLVPSRDEIIAEWGRRFDWLNGNGVVRAITYRLGRQDVPYDFPTLHRLIAHVRARILTHRNPEKNEK